MNSKLAPIALFVYNRLDTLEKIVPTLANNKLASQSSLYIFSDSWKSETDLENVKKVRLYLTQITGFKSITIFESSINKGLAKSIIDGVSKVLETNDSVIVLEDDLLVSSNFLSFMNESLTFYENNNKVLSICGFSMPISIPESKKKDIYFTFRSSSWGWATWKNRWTKIDWNMKDYQDFIKDKKQQRKFNQMGSDMTHMLKKQYEGKINSWAIRFNFHQFQKQLLSVHPTKSKVINIGLNSEEATHTKGMTSRFKTNLDTSDKMTFIFQDSNKLNPQIIKKFIKPYSIKTRIKYKILGVLK